MSRKALLERKDDIAAVGAEGEAEFIGAKANDFVFDVLRVAEFEDGVVGSEGTSFGDGEVVFLGEVVQGGLVGLTDLAGHLIGDGGGLLIDLLEKVGGTDGILHFVEGLGVGVLFVEDLDDVEAVLSADEVGNFALVETEGGLIEFRDGLAVNEPAEVATFGLGAGILGVFLGEFLEIGALLSGLGEDVLGLLLDFGDFGVGLADGGQQNVLGVDAVGNLVLLDVLLVDGLQLVVGDRGVLAELVEVEKAVADDAFFGNLELGLVLLVIGLDLGVVGIDFVG